MRKATAASTPLTADQTIPYTPPSLLADKELGREAHPTLGKAVFHITLPTFQERDEIGVLIYRMGVRQVSNQNIRSLMVSELYEIYDEETADETARFLESHWQLSEQDQLDINLWTEQEIQRLADIDADADPKLIPPAKPKPELRTTVRNRARVDMIVQDIVDRSQRTRDKLADQQMYDTRFRNITVRIQLGKGGWTGLKTVPEFEESLGTRVVTAASLEALRGELAAVPVSWIELAEACADSYDVSETERKNSDSPPLNGSPPDGSSSESAASEANGGSSTGSNTGQAPADE